MCNKTKDLNPRITRLRDLCPNHSATPTIYCVLLFDFYKNYRTLKLFFGLSVGWYVLLELSTLFYKYINQYHYQAFYIYMYRGVSSFKLTKHLLGVESSLAPMYSKIPVRRICDKKE